MGGRDLVFIASALDLSRVMTFLAEKAAQTTNPNLKAFGEELTRTLAAHAAVINSVAEMRGIKPPKESPTEKRLAEKFAKYEGIKLEKTIMDAFLDIDERLIATYRLGLTSDDTTISKFVEQALPQAEKHLHRVQSMAGIAPKRSVPPNLGIASTQKSTAPETTSSVKAETPEAAPAPSAPPLPPKPPVPPVAILEELPSLPDLPPLPAPVKPVADRASKPAHKPPVLPDPIAEPPRDEAPKKLEGELPKPAKKPVFRTNVKPLSE